MGNVDMNNFFLSSTSKTCKDIFKFEKIVTYFKRE